MKIREELILKAPAGEETKVELAAKFGVSRKTLYKWLDRYKERGLAGLVDESRRPRSSPMVTSPELALAAMQLRKAHPSWGPKKVVAVLARQYPGESIPSVSTTSRILRQAGFKTRLHRRSSGGFPPAPRQFTPVDPNDLWTVDFKGWWRTLDGTRCDPLTVRHAVSRYVLAMRGMTRTRTEDVRPVFEELFDRYGLPRAIHSDNGPPFASLRGPGGLTQLSAWWVSLGIQVVRSRPGHPQDNGAHERMHVDVRFDIVVRKRSGARGLDGGFEVALAVRPDDAGVAPTGVPAARTSLAAISTRSSRRVGRSPPGDRTPHAAPATRRGRRRRTSVVRPLGPARSCLHVRISRSEDPCFLEDQCGSPDPSPLASEEVSRGQL